jgi:small-conductance mechanosensitive channel
VRLALILIGLAVIQHLYGLDQDLFGTLHALHLLAVGNGDANQPLWLTVGDLITAALILTGTMVLLRNLPGLFEVAVFPRVRWDAGLCYVVLTLSRYLLLLIALWWSLAVLHLRWGSIQWIVAAASVGLGCGLQEIVSNFVSGLILLVERPISVGDFAGAGGQKGTVTRTTIRATTIQNLDNHTVIIPNKEFISGHVTNWTLSDTYVRVIVPVGVAYGSDIELVRRLLTAVVTTHPKVLRYPLPQVLFHAFGESALIWEVWIFVPSPRERFIIAKDLLLRIDALFQEHSVHIPFPQRDLHLRSADADLELRVPGNGRPLAEVAKVQTTVAPVTARHPALQDQTEPL